MTIDTFAQNMLRELSDGKEINWDYMPNMVEDGKVSRQDAVASLKQGLVGSILPEYRKFAETGDRGYWGQRLAEAEKALRAIETGDTVKYRGIEL